MAEKIKFKVSVKELSFEYEGTREVGQALQAGLGRSLAALVDTQRTVMIPAPPIAVLEQTNGNGDGSGPVAIDQGNHIPKPLEKPKKPRKYSGVSLIGLLRDLKSENFFSEARSVDVIRDKLKTKGHIYKDSRIGAGLLDLIKKDELYRSTIEELWLYKDSPFNEDPGTTNPRDQPAE